MPVTGLLGGCSICWGGHGGTPIVSGMTCGTTSSGTWVTRTTKELAFYRRYAPRQVPLATLVKIAGLRWPVEENFQASKTLTGLDEHQVRTWASWHRGVTLAMAALAFLTITAGHRTRQPAPATRTDPAHPPRDRPPVHNDHPASPQHPAAPQHRLRGLE
jgi:SRSO17 transposase